MGSFEEFGGDGFLYRVAIGQLVECFAMCRCDKMTKIQTAEKILNIYEKNKNSK